MAASVNDSESLIDALHEIALLCNLDPSRKKLKRRFEELAEQLSGVTENYKTKELVIAEIVELLSGGMGGIGDTPLVNSNGNILKESTRYFELLDEIYNKTL